ncbi:hypothetical protein GIB67_027308 [Kingdonia uniflora]|uniref:Uncharacterized protein n=1 Tax=Kingdonia uniflora TaxID=39325 RepID=A0A7J7KYS5_9MAGN|nr:hypothetical protein GIB67_027308 [Kingdonia uniflora]
MTNVEREEEMNRVYWSESMRIFLRSVEDRKEFVMMMAREEIINEDKDIASGLLKACGVEGFAGTSSCIVDPLLWISMVLTSDCAKADEVDLVGRLSPVIGVGDEEDIVAELVKWPRLKGSRVEYPMSCSQFREFCKAKISVDGIWGHAFIYREQFDYGLTLPLNNLARSVMNMIGACPTQLNCNFWEVILVCETLNERWATSGSESRITAKDFVEYYAMKYRSDEEPLELNNRTITKGIIYKVSRKESFIDSIAKEGTELEVALKRLGINRFKRVASKDDKVRRSQEKRRMAGKTLGSMEENILLMLLGGFSLVSRIELEKEREAAALRLKEVRAESVAEAERLVSAFTTSRNNLAGKLYQLRYTMAEIFAFSEGNYEKKEIVDEEKVEEMEDVLNVAEKTVADNQETIDQYDDRLDDNVKLYLKLEEAKSQVEDKTATLLSRDLALNQLINELVELKERAASDSRHDAELAEYRIRALND